MRRTRLALLLTVLLGCVGSHAAIPLNSLQTFDTPPDPANWATRTNGGNGGSFVNGAMMDAAVQTNEVSTLTNALPVASTDGTAQAARWNSTARNIQTRPTGIGYISLLATVQNTTGANLSTVYVAYNLGNPTPSPASEDPGLAGLRVFYSLSGAPSTWTLIPELTSGSPGSLLGTLPLAVASWPANALLYVLFVDDNGAPAGDGSYSIDNFQVVTTVSVPVITNQPKSTNILVAHTIRLSVGASGLGLAYQWFKDGVPIDGLANPSATQSTLVITNAQVEDSGSYYVTVSDATGGVISDNATVNVDGRGDPPLMLSFSLVPGSTNAFRLSVDEPLCEGPPFGACPFGDATFVFNWEFGEVGGAPTWLESIVPENGTNYIFTLPEGFVINRKKSYRLQPLPDSVTDRFNSYPLSGSITSSPVQIFNADVADAEIHSNAQADTALGAATSVTVDLDDAGIAQGLLRFNDLFGPGENQISAGTVIINATLILNQTDPGSAARFHRMLVNWDQATVTWNSLTNGVTADGVEAVGTPDGISVSEPFPNGPMHVDVTPSVQAWADGSPNYGWAILSTGTGGWDFSSAESGTPPILVVTYRDIGESFVPQITFHPASVTVTEGNSFILTAGVSGALGAIYQWTRNNVDIPGANGSSYTAIGVPGAGGNGGSYRLRVTNPNGTATSNPALVTINPDLTPPVITRVTGGADGTTVTLLFSKALSTAGTYAFEPTLADVTAALNNGAHTRTVTVSSAARTLTTPYRLTVTDTRDNRVSQNLISPNPSFVDLTGVSSVLSWAAPGNWNYATNDQAANPNWKTGTFGPEWLVGQQFFGFEPSASVTNALPIQPDPIKTPLQANDTNVLGTGNSEIFVSQYFHRQVTLPVLEPNTVFALSFYIDDGAIFYLDGVEIGRYQMPAGPVTFTTRSTGGNGEAVLQTLLFSAGAGTHHLAVEVHQAGVSSSDVVFGLQISKITVPGTLSIARDQGTNIVSWTADAAWGLTSSQRVNGNYAPVSGNPPRIFRVPPTAQTNNAFYRLQYTP